MFATKEPYNTFKTSISRAYKQLCQATVFVLKITDEARLTHLQAGTLGAPLEAGENMYIDLQKTYKSVLIPLHQSTVDRAVGCMLLCHFYYPRGVWFDHFIFYVTYELMIVEVCMSRLFNFIYLLS